MNPWIRRRQDVGWPPRPGRTAVRLAIGCGSYLLRESTIQFIAWDGEQFVKWEFGVFVVTAISVDHSWKR
jgi:hypothetical protein